MGFSTVAVVSYRLGGRDGVSVEAAKWIAVLTSMGLSVTTVAGAGVADVIVEGLAMDAHAPPDITGLARALAEVDLVVAENICSLPLNPAASRAVADALAGRPALIHHHDLPWQREGLGDEVPDDRHWVHVTVADLHRRQLAERGVDAVTVYNAFDTSAAPGRRGETREVLGLPSHALVALQPTRAIARKNVPAGLRVAEGIGAHYWLTGDAEEGYGPELARVLEGASVPVLHAPAPGEGPRSMADAYAAADVVLLPSTWEGFGNPAIEAAVHHRPLVIGTYPVASELARFGFRWFTVEEVESLRGWLSAPAERRREDIETNAAIARRHFSLESLGERLAAVLELSARRARFAGTGAGWPGRPSR